MTPTNSDDARWMAEQVLPHESALRAFLLSHFSGIADVDDLVQEAFARIMRAYAAGPVKSPRGLLFSIARNLAIDALRRRQVVPFEPIPEDPASSVFMDAVDVVDSVNKQQELEFLTQAIQSLPERCRQVFTLRAIYGLSQREIAEKLGITENTVEKQMQNGIRRCGEFFDRHGLR